MSSALATGHMSTKGKGKVCVGLAQGSQVGISEMGTHPKVLREGVIEFTFEGQE